MNMKDGFTRTMEMMGTFIVFLIAGFLISLLVFP